MNNLSAPGQRAAGELPEIHHVSEICEAITNREGFHFALVEVHVVDANDGTTVAVKTEAIEG